MPKSNWLVEYVPGALLGWGLGTAITAKTGIDALDATLLIVCGILLLADGRVFRG